MLAQEVFNKTVTDLVAQGGPSVGQFENGSLRCLYRGPYGRKCGVGIHIPDALYDPSMEGSSVYTLWTLPCPHLPAFQHRLLMRHIQNAHDYLAVRYEGRDFTREPFLDAFIRVAADHRLDTSVLEEVAQNLPEA